VEMAGVGKCWVLPREGSRDRRPRGHKVKEAPLSGGPSGPHWQEGHGVQTVLALGSQHGLTL
jgi:hypothetical protein